MLCVMYSEYHRSMCFHIYTYGTLPLNLSCKNAENIEHIKVIGINPAAMATKHENINSLIHLDTTMLMTYLR